jgi:hypothetical protein
MWWETIQCKSCNKTYILHFLNKTMTTINTYKEVYEEKDNFSWISMRTISIDNSEEDTMIMICSWGVCIEESLDLLVKNIFEKGGVNIINKTLWKLK